jgi:hypothetical protein
MCLSDGSHCGNNDQFVLIHVKCTTANRLFREKNMKEKYFSSLACCRKGVNLLILLIVGRKLKL